MRFHLEHRFAGPADAVVDVLLDPAFIAELGALPDIDPPELVEQRREGPVVRQHVRYRFTGSLSSAVTRVVDPDRLVWVEETTFERGRGLATFVIVPDHYANRLRCNGTHRFDDVDGGSRRVTDGELTVRYAVIGRAVERAIASGIERHLASEAELVDDWLRRPRDG